MIPEVEKVFQAGSCAKNTALIQAGSEAGNMNQGLVPAGFFAFGVGTFGLGNSLFVSIGRRNPRVAAHEGSSF
jgi:hypothetical protein